MFTKRARLWLGLMAALAVLSLGSSCSKTETPTDDGGTASGTAYTSKGDEGTITGTVAFAGAAPAAVKIDTSADPQCAAKSANLMSEEWAVKDGKLANTFVYIKDGTLADGKKIGDFTWAAPSSPATLDQNGCHYRPHVFGVVVKQSISITNSDPTTHNVHIIQGLNPDWNQSQPNGAGPLTHKLNVAETMVQVKCNQHPWMKAYVGVLKHPYFAVSAENGSFTIANVPPGTYTVVAWHEGPGKGTEKTIQVTVPAKGSGAADFSFGASADLRGQPGSMPMLALEVPFMRH